MKILYLDCGMGAAGDMLSAALLELIPDQDRFIEDVNKIGIPGVCIETEKTEKCGIKGTHVHVKVNGCEEVSKDPDDEEHDSTLNADSHDEHHGEDDHNHEHSDDDHHHSHRHMHDTEETVKHLDISDKVKADVINVYKIIAAAESSVHGMPVSEIHFHEVGAKDAIADITMVCMLMDMISPEKVIVSPIHVGSGHVHCAHGVLPVPAPATALILKDVPIYGGEIKGELCTPTGAALLKYFADEFGDMPVMKSSAIGYGLGQKDFERANLVRSILGEADAHSENKIVELSCNVDDMTAEKIGFAMERFYEAGAVEVYTIPVGMKKSRPGQLITVMCHEADREKMIRAVFKYTSTIGIRENISKRYTLDRQMTDEDTPVGKIRKKISTGYGITREKYEYEDIAKAAVERGTSISEIERIIEGREQ